MQAPNKWTVAVVVAFGPAMALMDSTIVSVILSQMQQTFHTDFATITWVAAAYFLAQAAVIPIVGYVSDRVGSTLVYLTALALFTVGSLLCALAPTKEALFAFRVLQGIGGGALVPMGLAIVYRTFPPNERATVAGVISIPIMLARTLGPTIGGYLSTNFSWNAVFMINVPLGSVALLLCFLLLPRRISDQSEQAKGVRKQFDILGLSLAMAGVTTLVFGIAQVGSVGWSDQTALIPILMGVAILVVFVVVELRVSDPVMDLQLFLNPTFTISSLLIWMILGIATGGLFLLPLFFENVQGNTALTAGSFMIGQGVGLAASMLIAGVLYNRVGPRILTVFGLLLLVSSTYGLTQIDVNTTGQSLQIWLLLRGLSLGFVYQPAQMLAYSVVSNKGMAKATSLANITEQVATATAVAVLTAYLTGQTATYGVGRQALAMGMADTFWFVLILTVICIPLALFMRRDPAIETQKQAKAPRDGLPLLEARSVATSRGHIISTLTANSEEMMGPEILLWHYPKNDIVNGSLLTVESNHFCVLKLQGTVLKVYEAGQHVVQTLDFPLFGSVQLAFDGKPIPWQYEAIYINLNNMIGEFKNVVITRKMEEMGYCVYYSIQVATQKDAVQLIQRMLYSGHTLNMRDINAYAGPVIEKAVNQFFLITPQGLQIVQDLSQLIHQRLQPFLSNYGITLGMVKVHTLRPHDTHLHSQGQFLKRETREQSAIPHVIRLVPLESHAPEAHHPKSSNH